MARTRPATIPEYIQAAPREGHAHLRRVYAILKSAAPDAEEAIKWGVPFFVNPRFVYTFNACKAHLNFAPSQAVLKAFRKELKDYQTTKNFLQIRYDEPLPEALIRKIAKYRVKNIGEGESFW